MEVTKAAIQTGIIGTEDDFEILVSNAFPKKSAPDANISGKFLMALTMHHIKRKLKCCNLTLDSLTYRMARHSKLEGLELLRVKINTYLVKNIKPTH